MKYIIDHIKKILQHYSCKFPLSQFLKQYFKENPSLGSRDRKAISEAVYLYFRFATWFSPDDDALSIVKYALNTSNTENPFLTKILSGYDAVTITPARIPEEKYPILSQGLNFETWISSIQQQPDLFIRLRKNGEIMTQKLGEENIAFKRKHFEYDTSQVCLALPNGSKLDQLFNPKDYVVQDYSSQYTIYYLLQMIQKNSIPSPNKIWDVCAGAGGKSLLLSDIMVYSELTVSDNRSSILHNLKSRFNLYKIKQPNTIIVQGNETDTLRKKMKNKRFDLIICDVPCSGSGTWARTPEQFHYFNAKSMMPFSENQFKIACNASEYLTKNGLLVYITCSVFEKENEYIVDQISEKENLTLIGQKLINGIKDQADCMFIAILQKNNKTDREFQVS